MEKRLQTRIQYLERFKQKYVELRYLLDQVNETYDTSEESLNWGFLDDDAFQVVIEAISQEIWKAANIN